jgi:hypothetical protein
MKMVRSRLADHIFLVTFDTQYALASTFLRIQEHYESSRFRNRVFTLEEFMDWYAAEFGAFTYFEDWSGFNVPSAAFEPFFQGRFDPLLRKEQRLLAMFRREKKPFYVIGLSSKEDLKHELAHALFHTRPEYKKAVQAAMRDHDTSAIEKRLAAMGYHKSVLPDEVHAYLVSPEEAPGSHAALAPLRSRLRELFRKHSAEAGLPASRTATADRRGIGEGG